MTKNRFSATSSSLPAEAFGESGGEGECLAGGRVDEGKCAGMKGKTPERVGTGPVFPITGNRMSYPLCMNAYLVLAACFKFEFHQGIALPVNLPVLKFQTMA